MTFSPQVFGEGFHRFVQTEYQLFGFLSPYVHIIALALLVLVFILGNKIRRVFTLYFALNWLFLFGYWGVYGVIYWYHVGLPYLLTYTFAPILLFLILLQWLKEIKRPQIHLDFSGVNPFRFSVLLILICGFWYPTYQYGQGFIFQASDLLRSYFGLMPCPTTMFVLSLFSLNYPKGNPTLFHLMTVYAVFIGTATVAAGWLADVPFILLGLYALILILFYKKHPSI